MRPTLETEKSDVISALILEDPLERETRHDRRVGREIHQEPAQRLFNTEDTEDTEKVKKRRNQVALHFLHYNFARIHKTLRITPAMAAGISDHVWSMEEIAMLADASYAPKKRGPYKKTAI